jgi:hypothetical protein
MVRRSARPTLPLSRLLPLASTDLLQVLVHFAEPARSLPLPWPTCLPSDMALLIAIHTAPLSMLGTLVLVSLVRVKDSITLLLNLPTLPTTTMLNTLVAQPTITPVLHPLPLSLVVLLLSHTTVTILAMPPMLLRHTGVCNPTLNQRPTQQPTQQPTLQP